MNLSPPINTLAQKNGLNLWAPNLHRVVEYCPVFLLETGQPVCLYFLIYGYYTFSQIAVTVAYG